jgi:hypothetical protein
MANPLNGLKPTQHNKTETTSPQQKKGPTVSRAKVPPSSSNTAPTPKIDLSKIGSLRKKEVPTDATPKKELTFTEGVLARAKEQSKYKKFIERNFDNDTIRSRTVQLYNAPTSSNTRNVVILDSNFQKKASDGITDINYLETLLKELEEFREVQDPSSLTSKEASQKHAQARLLLFYQLCAGYYNTKTTDIRYEGATLQAGRGKNEGEEACHHALFAATTDSAFWKLANQVTNALEGHVSKNSDIDETILLLLSLGIKKETIDKFIDDAKKKDADVFELTKKLFSDEKFLGSTKKEDVSILNERNLLYFMHNHTIVAASHLNRVDEMVEQLTRDQAKNILLDVAVGKKTPLEGALELTKLVEKALAESGKALVALQQKADTIDKLSKEIIDNQNPKGRPEVAIQALQKTLDALQEALRMQEKTTQQFFKKPLLLKDYKEEMKKVLDFNIFASAADKKDFDEYVRTGKEPEQTKIGDVFDRTFTQLKAILVPSLKKMQNSISGKYLNPETIKVEQSIIASQLKGTQDLLLKLKAEKEPEDYTLRHLEALKQTVKTKRQ